MSNEPLHFSIMRLAAATQFFRRCSRISVSPSRFYACRNFSLQSCHQSNRNSHNTLVVVATLAASTILLSTIISQKSNNKVQHTECSASEGGPTDIIRFAKPIKDINTIYKLGPVLGEGGYGQVMFATRHKDGKAVALKCIPKEWTLQDEFQREAKVLRKLNNEAGGHPHICAFYDMYEGDDFYWMAMELIEGGELFEHLIEEGAYSEAQAAIFLRQFAEALAFMHKAGVVHGDLKPENLLLSSWDNDKAELKVVDFGCSLMLDRCEEEEKSHSYSTIAYDPPEKLENDSTPTYKSDVWAAGCILYIILTGSHPFDKQGSDTEEQIAERVKSIGASEEKLTKMVFDERSESLSPSAISLLHRMLQPDPTKRMTSEEIRRNRWVQGLTASWEIMEGIDDKLERYWKKEFRSKITNKFACVATDEQSLRSVFAQIDEDGNGSIDLEELSKVLREAGTKPKDIQSIFDAINLDHGNAISFETFRCVMRNELSAQYYQSRFRKILEKELQTESTDKMSPTFRVAARRLFNSMDLDHNGSLDCHELRLVLRKLGVGEKEISFLVASVDLDKDGSLTFDEFTEVLFGVQSKTDST